MHKGGNPLACALAVAALLGCSNSRAGTMSLAEFGDASAQAICEILQECYGPVVLEIFLVGDCREAFSSVFEDRTLPRLQAAIEMGTLEYHGEHASACLDAMRTAGCAVIDRVNLEPCEALFVGTVPPGGACAVHEECAGDAYCQLESTCPGTCQARVGPGGACRSDDACQAGLRCTTAAGSPTCQAPARQGAPCSDSSVLCAGGLFCFGASGDPGEPRPGTCETPASLTTAASGARCDPRPEAEPQVLCQPGLSCALTGVEGGTMPLFECVAPSPSGGRCHFGIPDPCPDGEYCDAMPFAPGGSFEGTCRPLPIDGQACVQNRCAAGHRCDGSTCRAVRRIGGACESNDDCQSGHCASGFCAEAEYCPSA